MRPIRLDFDMATVDPDGLADGNSSAGATLTLDGTLTSGGTFTSADGLAHRLSITDLGADDQTGATYTITGTDSDDHPLVGTRAGPGASATVETTDYFKTVTSVAIASPAAGSTVDMGTVDEIASQTIAVNSYKDTAPLVSFDITGTINVDVELSNDNPFDLTRTIGIDAAFQITNQNDMLWINDDSLAGLTADAHGSVSDWPVKALRIIVNSYSAGAEVQVEITTTR